MTTFENIWKKVRGGREAVAEAPAVKRESGATEVTTLDVQIAPNDPLVAYFQSNPGVVEVDRLSLDSPALEQLREAGVKVIVPLVSQGELIGMLNLGPRLSEQEYSTDDRKLLNDLATQAAPAVRVAQLAREQQIEARQRERIEQELRVARLIQQTLLPRSVPDVAGYAIAAHYQPARAVGGDFYDFFEFDDGELGIVIGDVTDKGVPAALVMATTRTLLRAASERLRMPSQVLERVNELLYPDIPPRMFVTCLYAVLDPKTGQLRYANAGHDLPYRRCSSGVDELRATGMPLGLMPDMTYEEKSVLLEPGETVLFHSDGLVEAHNSQREMYGFPRLQETMGRHPGGATLIEYLLEELKAFTGEGWEQEDDVTLVTLQNTRSPRRRKEASMREEPISSSPNDESWKPVVEFELASKQGNERRAVQTVAEAVEQLGLSSGRLEKLKTAVAEATMNAMEHGNKYREDVPVAIKVWRSSDSLVVRITDQGGGLPIPDVQTPDLEAKLAGQQSPRGWGLFLIENMVDEMNVSSDDVHHTIELVMHLEEGE